LHRYTSGWFGSASRSLSGIGVAAAAAQACFGGVSKVLIRVLSGGLNSSGGTTSASGGGNRGSAEAVQIKKEHPLTTMCYTNVACVVGMTALALWSAAPPTVPPNKSTWVLFLWAVSSLSGFAAQICITSALGLASAGFVWFV
jgi:hypothetical protein